MMIEIDLAAFIAPVITVAIGIIGVYIAIESRLTKTETIIAALQKSLDEQANTKERMATIEATLNNLCASVNKHNNVVERTFKIESDQATCFKRLDEVREQVNEVRKELQKK